MLRSRRTGAVNSIDHPQWPPKNQFATEMDHFADAIRADTVPHPPGGGRLADLKIMQAIYEAAAGGRALKLPLVTGRGDGGGGGGWVTRSPHAPPATTPKSPFRR